MKIKGVESTPKGLAGWLRGLDAPPEPAAPAASGPPPVADHHAVVNQLFRQHNRSLVNFLMSRLSSEQEARDVAQEAYVKLLQLDRPGAIGFLRGYLFRIAANLSVDRLRHRKVQEKAALELFEEFAPVDAPEREAMGREEFDRIARVLDGLPQRHRQAFVRHVVEGYSTMEVSREMRIDERTVRKYVTHALVQCRQVLGADAGMDAGRGDGE